MARALVAAAFGPEGEFVVALEAAAETALWLYDKYPLIKAYLDGPKSLEELQENVGKPGKGYDVHHIVEQTAADREGHSQAEIDGPDNLVRIPRLKHWETISTAAYHLVLILGAKAGMKDARSVSMH
jgi:hypothetical protein